MRVYNAYFSADARRIVTAGGDATVRVWDARGGEELLQLPVNCEVAQSVALSPDGRQIVCGSNDGTLKLWQAGTDEDVGAWEDKAKAIARISQVMKRKDEERQKREKVDFEESLIQQWLTLAPIALPRSYSAELALDTEQIPGEGRIQPKAGEQVIVSEGALKWKELARGSRLIDFNVAIGKETTQSVAYAVSYLRSDAAQHKLRMFVQNDDFAKVYLNGRQIYKTTAVHPAYLPYEAQVSDLELNAGLNTLVFKVGNLKEFWQGAIRITDDNGHSIKGVTFTVDPQVEERSVNSNSKK